MKFWTRKKWTKLLRSLHRDLGYFFVGIICIYAISGIILTKKTEGKDSAYSETQIEKKLQSLYSIKKLKAEWTNLFPEGPKLTHITPSNKNYIIYIKGGEGEYIPKKGLIKLTIYKERKFIKFINEIHYNGGRRFTWLAYLFAIGLLFFAISGLIIVKGKNGFKKRGVWFMIAGILIPILWYYL